MALENPKKWRFAWEAQSHAPILKLFVFDSYTSPTVQCRDLKADLNLSQSLITVSWTGDHKESEVVSLRVPLPRVLIDSESPLSYRALDDHIEVKIVLLLPVDHPIISNFDSVLNLDGENELADAAKPLAMDSDVKSLSSAGGVHLYCRNCSTKLTSASLRHFMEMPSVNWREVADNWFGACCCSFGGISEKLVTSFANSYAIEKDMCLLTPTTITLCKDGLEGCKFPALDMGQQNNPSREYNGDNGSSDVMRDEPNGEVSMCDLSGETICGKLQSIYLKDNWSSGNFNSEATSENKPQGTLGASECSKYMPSVSCFAHQTGNVSSSCSSNGVHNTSQYHSMHLKATETLEVSANQRPFLNGYLGNVFMARSSNVSTDVEWKEFFCYQCSNLLGAYPCSSGNAPIDDRVRLFKCSVSTCLPVDGSNDIFRNYTMARMFSNQLLESARDELSFRTVVRDLTTKSPMLQIVLLNGNSWLSTGHCLDRGDPMKSNFKLILQPVVKILFSYSTSSTVSQMRVIEEWGKKNQAEEVFMFKGQIEELFESLYSLNNLLPASCTRLQDMTLSFIQR